MSDHDNGRPSGTPDDYRRALARIAAAEQLADEAGRSASQAMKLAREAERRAFWAMAFAALTITAALVSAANAALFLAWR